MVVLKGRNGFGGYLKIDGWNLLKLNYGLSGVKSMKGVKYGGG